MKLGMRHVINRAALAGAFAFVSTSAFAQLYQDRRQYGAPQQQRQQLRPAPQRQAAPPPRVAPSQPQQQPQAQAQPARQRSEPFVMPRGPCFNKELAADALVAACAAVIEAGKEKPQALAVAHANRGEVYREKGDLDKAMADLDQALTLDPRNANAAYNRGLAYRAKGEHDSAIQDFDLAIKLDPKNAATIYNSRSHANYEKRDYERAIQDLNQAIRLNPRYTLAIYNRGMAYRAKGEPERAVPDYHLVLKMSPSDAMPTITAASPIAICATTTARSRISTRRSRSTRT